LTRGPRRGKLQLPGEPERKTKAGGKSDFVLSTQKRYSMKLKSRYKIQPNQRKGKERKGLTGEEEGWGGSTIGETDVGVKPG